MNIGILTNTYPPNLNGVSISVKNLEQGLMEKGVNVFVATPQVENVVYPDHVLGLRALATNDDFSPDLYLPYRFIDDAVEFFRKNKVDLIHTHDIFVGGAEGIVIAEKLGIPCIHTFHTFVESYPYLNVPKRREIVRTHIRLVCNNYTHVTAPSLKVYKYLAKVGFKTPVTQLINVPTQKNLKVIPKDRLLAEKYDIKDEDFVFITFCRIAKEKSVEIGMEILRKILLRTENVKYLICGQGPEIDDLKKVASSLGIGDKVIFTGKYTPDDLSDLASLANVFVFTSHTENLPTNLFEAMCLGLPVLSVDDESVDYLLKHGVNGYKGSVEELGEKALELYESSELVEELSQNALDSANKLLSKDVAQDYIDLYTRVIKFYHENPREEFDEEGLLDIVSKFPRSIKNKIKEVLGMD